MEVDLVKRGLLGLMVGVLLAGAAPMRAQTATAVAKLDLNAVTGVWYQVARLPDKSQKHCVGDVMQLIADGDKLGRLKTVRTCKTKAGYTEVRNGRVKPANKSGDGELKLTYIWPFSTKFWVLAIGAEDQWLLVGDPNHKNLWVLSKTAKLTAADRAEIEAKMAAEGYAPEKLMGWVEGKG